MHNRTDDKVRNLRYQYLFQVRKFLEALKGNASPTELYSIRKSAKELFNEIRKSAEIDNLIGDQSS